MSSSEGFRNDDSDRGTPAPDGPIAPGLTRVAVVQLAYHPAVRDQGGESPLEDPLFESGEPPSLLPRGTALPSSLQKDLKELKGRVREVYVHHLWGRARAVLSACKGWGVQVVVFPEYSLPHELLPKVAEAAPDMVVVAGTHTVDRVAVRSRIYEQLQAPSSPELAQSVCPILHRGRIIALQPKLNPAVLEQPFMRRGTSWEPVAIPGDPPVLMGILICLDFLYRESSAYQNWVQPRLADCGLLVVPSLTPSHTLDEFKGKASEEAKRYRRPVLYCNHADEGGSTVFLPSRRAAAGGAFPDVPGVLERGDEGVVVADIDLRLGPGGEWTPYDATRRVVPFAAATLVYSARLAERDYALWLTRLAKMGGDGLEELERVTAHVQGQTEVLNAVRQGTRGRRIDRLVSEVENVSGMDRIGRLTREVVVPDESLPLAAMRSAMATGAADVVHSWIEKVGPEAHLLGEVEARLRRAGKRTSPVNQGTWTGAGGRTFAEVASAVRGEAPVSLPAGVGVAAVVSVYAEVVEKRFAEDQARAEAHFRAGEMEQARGLYRTLADEAEKLASADPTHADAMKQLGERFRLHVAFCTVNLQEIEEGAELLRRIHPERLSPEGRVALAAAFAQTGDVARARALLPESEENIPGVEASRLSEARDLLSIGEGVLPPPRNPGSDVVHLASAHLLRERWDFDGAAIRAREALEIAVVREHWLTAADAFCLLVTVLIGTTYEQPTTASFIVPERRAEAVRAIEAGAVALREQKLPEAIRANVEERDGRYRRLTLDFDALPDDFQAEEGSDSSKEGSPDRLVRTGRLEEALLAIAGDDHPWLGRYRRARLMRLAGRTKEAINELSRLEGKALVEYLFTECLLLEHRAEEALIHAERAAALLPGKGYQLLYARALLGAGRAREAWQALQPFLGSRRPEILRLLAGAAEVSAPAAAPDLYRRYLTKRPLDGQAKVQLALAVFHVRDAEEAARIAWDAFGKHAEKLNAVGSHAEKLDAVSLYNCGLLQRLRGDLDEKHKGRVRQVAESLRAHFPGDARAEGLRFQLLRTLGAEGQDPIDMDLVVQSGVIEVLPFAEGMRRILLMQSRSQAIEAFYRKGALPLSDRCRLVGISPAESIVLAYLPGAEARLTIVAPIGLGDAPPPVRLDGGQLLVSEVELSFLAMLDLLDPLRAALGERGKILLSIESRQRIVDDAVKLGALVDPADLQKKEQIVDLLDGKGELAQPISVPAEEGERIRLDRDRLAGQVRATRVAVSVHDFLRQGLSDGWILEAPVPADVADLLLLRPPQDGVDPTLLNDLVLAPLRTIVETRKIMEANPECWRLTVDLFGSGNLGHPATYPRLAWDAPRYLELSSWNRALALRDLYLPALVRRIAPPAARADLLVRLAEMGFTDALGAEEICERLVTRPAAADVILERMEWIASDPEHVGASLAHLRITGVYAEAIWLSFVGPEGSQATPDEDLEKATKIASVLLNRLEIIDQKTDAACVERAISFLGLKTAERPRASYTPSGEGQVVLSESSRGAALWRFIATWAREDVRRRTAFGRAVREVWGVLAGLRSDGPSKAMAMPLTLTFDIVQHQVGAVDLRDPELESVAILSANWSEKPLFEVNIEMPNPLGGAPALCNLEQVIGHGVAILGESSDIVGDDTVFRYPFPISGLTAPVIAHVPPEAVLLRAKARIREALAREWAPVQGPSDGRLYELLMGIAEKPEDPEIARKYALVAATAPFRLVRDDPEFLRTWPKRQSLSGEARLPTIEDLRQILCEPAGPLLEDVSLEDFLFERMEKGIWSSRPDRAALFFQAVEVPGALPAGALGTRLAEPGYSSHVEDSFDRLENPDDQPAPRLAGDIVFLRVAAAEKPRVRLSRGEVDLREEVPNKLVQLVSHLFGGDGKSQERVDREAGPQEQAHPSKLVHRESVSTTTAEAEAPLLRTCRAVVNELASRSGGVRPRDRLWLTYRLFQWFLKQLDRLDGSDRREALKRLVNKSPAASDGGTDLLDPSHFSRDRFDHRLATVIHALAAAEEVARRGSSRERAAGESFQLSSRALESKLARIAEMPCVGRERTSCLPWHAVGHVPDLAFVTLLRLNPEGLFLLSLEARLRRIQALPREPDAETDPRRGFNEALILTLSDHAGRLTQEERALLEEKLQGMDQSPTSHRYRWIGQTCLFATGATHLEAKARTLFSSHLKDPLAPVMFGRLLVGVGALDPSRLEGEVKSLFEVPMADGVAGDPRSGMVAAGLGRVALHGSPAARVVARKVLASLAEQARFREDPSFMELLRYLNVSISGAAS